MKKSIIIIMIVVFFTAIFVLGNYKSTQDFCNTSYVDYDLKEFSCCKSSIKQGFFKKGFVCEEPNSYLTYNNKEEPLIEKKIYVKDDVLNKLNEKFMDSDIEFMYCLYGKPFRDGYLIKDIEEIPYERASEVEIIPITPFCTKDNYLGTLHNHPNNVCYLSDRDKYFFSKDYRERKTKITGLMCDVNKLNFYIIEEFDDPTQPNLVVNETSKEWVKVRYPPLYLE